MQMFDRNYNEPITEYSAFRDIYRFILRAVGGDIAIAKAMFERYLAGELSEELLTISRQCVEEDRVDRLSKASAEGGDCHEYLRAANLVHRRATSEPNPRH
jgi:hypothetical protein